MLFVSQRRRRCLRTRSAIFEMWASNLFLAATKTSNINYESRLATVLSASVFCVHADGGKWVMERQTPTSKSSSSHASQFNLSLFRRLLYRPIVYLSSERVCSTNGPYHFIPTKNLFDETT